MELEGHHIPGYKRQTYEACLRKHNKRTENNIQIYNAFQVIIRKVETQILITLWRYFVLNGTDQWDRSHSR
jgi:hypothetical protein